MTPASAIKSLDRQLAMHGSTLVLKRGDPATPSATVTVKGYPAAFRPEKFIGSSKQGDSMIVLSPTALGAYGEPAEDEWAVFGGRTLSIYFVRRKLIANTLVRLELLVRG